MRSAFFLLVFANLAFFAWAQGYFGGQDAGREPQRLANPLAPEKLRIVAATGADSCRLVGGMGGAEAEKLKAALEGAGLKADLIIIEEAPSYWAHVPPQGSKAAAEKKVAELRKLGVADLHVVEDEGPNRYAISLGAFRNEAAAVEFLQELAKKGVKTARIEVRERAPRQARLVVRGVADELGKRLPELLKGISGATASDCPAQ